MINATVQERIAITSTYQTTTKQGSNISSHLCKHVVLLVFGIEITDPEEIVWLLGVVVGRRLDERFELLDEVQP